MNENEKDSVFEILKVLIRMEEERNVLFKKTLYFFLATVLGITAILSISNLISLNSLFIK